MLVALLPAYREERRISRVVEQAYRYVDKVIVCDDGSTDSTYQRAIESGAEVIRHIRNKGHGTALRSLFLRARSFAADAYVTIDADGQHDSAYVPAITEPVVERRADLVIGSRFLFKPWDFTPPHRRLAINLVTRVCDTVMHSRFTDLQSGFRAYNDRALALACPTRPGMGASTEIILRATKSRLRIHEVPLPIHYNGKKNSPLSSTLQFLDVFHSILASAGRN